MLIVGGDFNAEVGRQASEDEQGVLGRHGARSLFRQRDVRGVTCDTKPVINSTTT